MITLFVLGKEDQVVVVPVLSGILVIESAFSHIDLATEDGLDTLSFAFLVKVNDSEHVAVISYRNGIHAQFLDFGDEFFDIAESIEEGILRMQMQMCESSRHSDLLSKDYNTTVRVK